MKLMVRPIIDIITNIVGMVIWNRRTTHEEREAIFKGKLEELKGYGFRVESQLTTSAVLSKGRWLWKQRASIEVDEEGTLHILDLTRKKRNKRGSN